MLGICAVSNPTTAPEYASQVVVASCVDMVGQ